jgi:hypothetical protein
MGIKIIVKLVLNILKFIDSYDQISFIEIVHEAICPIGFFIKNINVMINWKWYSYNNLKLINGDELKWLFTKIDSNIYF